MRAARRLDLDRLRADCDARHRRVELHRQISRRAWPAARRSPAGRTHRRRARASCAKSTAEMLVQRLAAAERAEHEFDRRHASRRDPSASACAQATSALPRAASWIARLRASRWPRDSPPSRLRARCACRCAASVRAAPGRFRAARERELRDRIDVRHVDPVRAAIERHAEGACVGDAAPADHGRPPRSARSACPPPRPCAPQQFRPRPHR